MSALGRHAGGFQPCRSCADDRDAAPFGRARNIVRHRFLAPGGGVVQAKGQPALIDPVQAIVGADAGADIVLASLHDLADQVRVSLAWKIDAFTFEFPLIAAPMDSVISPIRTR